MTSIDKLRKDREIALRKLDDAMDKCKPEVIKMDPIVKKSTSEFLTSYKNYKDQKISEQEFLQITNNFAQTLILEEKMIAKNRKILEPLDTEFQKICKKIHDWEDKPSQDNKWWERT